MEIVSKIVMVSINETLFVELISFLIFLFLINRIMFRPLQGVMKQRDEHIDGLSRDISEAQKKITDLNTDLEEQERQAVDEAARQRRELEEEGEKQAEEIMADCREKIDEMRTENLNFVNQQIAEARKQMQIEAERISKTMMEKILDRRLASE